MRVQLLKTFESTEQYLNSPIELVKGALLYDNFKESYMLQLKLRNISEKIIKSVYVKIIYFNDACDCINANNPIEYVYNNVYVPQFGDFGDDRAIYLSNISTDRVKVLFDKVVFSDDTVEMVNIKEPAIPREQKIIESEFKEQLLRDDVNAIDDNYIYYPIEYDGIWQCVCGRINNKDTCVRCGEHKEHIFSVADEEKLKENLSRFYEKQKSLRKMLGVIIACIVAIILIICITLKTVHEFQFNSACKLVESNQYSEALSKFNNLPNTYEDRTKYYLKNTMNNKIKEYKEYIISYDDIYAYCENLYKNLSDYDDTKKLINYIKLSKESYVKALSYEENAEYDNAISSYNDTLEYYHDIASIEHKNDENYDVSEEQEYKDIKLRKENCYSIYLEESLQKLEEYKTSGDIVGGSDFCRTLDNISSNEKIMKYKNYFSKVEAGQKYLKEGINLSYWSEETLYLDHDRSTITTFYIKGGLPNYNNTTRVYDYYVDDNNDIWLKIKTPDNNFYWIIRN